MGGQKPTCYYVLKTHKLPLGRTPSWTQSPSSIWPWLLAAVGFSLRPPLVPVTMAITDDKWGLAGLGNARLFLTKEVPCRPLSHTLCRPAQAQDITSCAGHRKWPHQDGQLQEELSVHLTLRNLSPGRTQGQVKELMGGWC